MARFGFGTKVQNYVNLFNNKKKSAIQRLNSAIDKLSSHNLKSEFKTIYDKIDQIRENLGMYEDLNDFEKALSHFGTRVDIIIALEMGNKIDPESAYKKIKEELKELKKIRKLHKKEYAGDYQGPLYAPHPDLLKEYHDN